MTATEPGGLGATAARARFAGAVGVARTGRSDLESHLAIHGPLPLPRRGDGAWA